MKDYSKLDDSALRIAVAKALGWTLKPCECEHPRCKREPRWHKPETLKNGTPFQAIFDELPDFPSDLNACHQFEKALLFPPTGTPAPEANAIWSRFDRYVEQLAKMCGSDEIFFATARQRCIALLQTLNP